MMNKTSAINALFEEWIEAQSIEADEYWQETRGKSTKISKRDFCRDGIIDESVFEKESRKILFVSNEANDENYEKSGDRLEQFKTYFQTGHDLFRGKLIQRICAIFNEITQQHTAEFHKLAIRFAFMNINKRGGCNTIGDGGHLKKYCELYGTFIKREIEIINPDLIIWLGVRSYRLGIPEMIGATTEDDVKILQINEKTIPIMEMWHTSYYRAKVSSIPCYQQVYDEYQKEAITSNKIIIKLAAKARMQMDTLKAKGYFKNL